MSRPSYRMLFDFNGNVIICDFLLSQFVDNQNITRQDQRKKPQITDISFSWQLLMRRNNLYQTSTERRQLLEESYKYQTFERDCDETKSWINEKLKTASDENYLVGFKDSHLPPSLVRVYWITFLYVLCFKMLQQTKDCNIGICCYSAMHAALLRKSKDWLTRNREIMYPSGVTCLPTDCCFSELAL